MHRKFLPVKLFNFVIYILAMNKCLNLYKKVFKFVMLLFRRVLSYVVGSS